MTFQTFKPGDFIRTKADGSVRWAPRLTTVGPWLILSITYPRRSWWIFSKPKPMEVLVLTNAGEKLELVNFHPEHWEKVVL